ncbi:MAG: phosphotransferase family protein, partial [Solirubrobacteraceae bacterium]
MHRWCNWVDERLAAPAEPVFVHGDFHPYNQLWDPRELRLLLVADFETSGVAEPEYDFRAIPSFGPGVDLLTSTVDHYMSLTGRGLSLERIMALHVCTSARLHVCTSARLHVCTSARLHVCTSARLHVCTSARPSA